MRKDCRWKGFSACCMLGRVSRAWSFGEKGHSESWKCPEISVDTDSLTGLDGRRSRESCTWQEPCGIHHWWLVDLTKLSPGHWLHEWSGGHHLGWEYYNTQHLGSQLKCFRNSSSVQHVLTRYSDGPGIVGYHQSKLPCPVRRPWSKHLRSIKILGVKLVEINKISWHITS